ncbi:MAG TPA: TetR/AcrR family transcriptional regulator [Symbiobacteriaceae bacterium]|jgi:AcrR family transcriptional regulator|nr:TetR/AcrR family transcriptional regulator [Symbiobacteriaceae bacterium]
MPKVSESHKENRREQILEAAGRCFSRKGYMATSMQEIFREAGLSAGAVYSYFKSKQELYLALMDQNLELDLRRYRAVVEEAAEPWAKLQALISFYMADFADAAQTEFFRLYFMEFLPSSFATPELAEALRARMDRLHQLLKQVLQEGVDQGAFRTLDCDAVASLILAAGDGVRLHTLAYGSRADATAMYNAFIGNLELAVTRR